MLDGLKCWKVDAELHWMPGETYSVRMVVTVDWDDCYLDYSLQTG